MHLFSSCIMNQDIYMTPCGDPALCKFCQESPSQLNLRKGYCVECGNNGVPGNASHLPVCAICEHRHVPLQVPDSSKELVEE